MCTLLLTLQVFVGRAQLGVLLQDLLTGEVAGLVGRERFGPFCKGHSDVGYDPCFADKVAVRGKPLGDAEQDRRAVPEDELREHGARAEGSLPDDGRAAVVPQGSGQYLGARGRTLVDQYDERRVRRFRVSIDGDLLTLAGSVFADVDYAIRLEEVSCHLHRLVEPAAGIVPEVEDKAPGPCRLCRLESVLELLGAVVGERGEEHDGYVGARDQGPRSHGRVYLCALEVVRSLLALVADGQLDPGSLRPLDLLDYLRYVVTPDALPVYGQEHVAGTDAGLLGRRAVYRGGDHDLTVLLLQLDPDPHVRSGEALVVLFALLGGQKARVTIVPERIEHPFYGPVRLFLGVYVSLVYVVVSDGVERLGIQREALPVLCA